LRLSLVPRERRFYTLFSRQAEIVAEALRELQATLADGRTRHGHLRELEHLCDEVTKEIYSLTNATFTTPIDREDILRLAAALDTVVDLAEEASDKIELYQVTGITDSGRRMGEHLASAGEAVAKAIGMLEDSGELPAALKEIHRLENEGDRTTREAMEMLLNGNHKTAVEVIKWKDVYDLLEATMDECESVAEIVETIAITGA
jgi:predicted phosphate transport protein (TIGR00153 family)